MPSSGGGGIEFGRFIRGRGRSLSQGVQESRFEDASALSLERAREQERRRIAGVIHDDVVQLLAVCQIKLETYRLRQPQGTELVEVSAALAALDQAITAARHLTSDLFPRVLNDQGLHAGLLCLATHTHAMHSLKVVFTGQSPAADSSPVEVRHVLFRTVRELLMNVVKHARASSAGIELQQHCDQIELTVADNGIGFPAAAAATPGACENGFGLFSIRQWVTEVGGSLEVTTPASGGSRCRVVVPMFWVGPASSLSLRFSH